MMPTPTRVAVYLADQNPQRDRSLGITAVTDQLLTGLSGFEDLELATLVSRSSYRFDGATERSLPYRTDNAVGRLAADNLHEWWGLPSADVTFYPKGFVPWLPRRGDTPRVGFMHDAILVWYAEHYPETRSRAAWTYWLRSLRRSLRNIDTVLTNSEVSRRQLVEAAEGFGVPPPEIVVIPLGSRYETVEPELHASDYVVHLASRELHKRTSWLLETWSGLLRDGHDLPPLRLVGSLPDGAERWVAPPAIIREPFLEEEAFQRCLANAAALVLPSEIEGFGLPAVEAYHLGTPVCYAAGTAMDEILDSPADRGAFGYEADSLLSALEAVLRFSQEDVLAIRQRLLTRYGSQQMAVQVREVLKSVS